MRVGDFSALCELKLRCLKVLGIGDIRKVIESELTELNDVLTIVNDYDVVKCAYRNIKLEKGLDIELIFNELSRCWISELLGILDRASAELVEFVKTYLTKYAISALIRSIKYLQVGGVVRPKHVFKCLDEGLLSSSSVEDVINVVRCCRDFNNSLITEVLYRYVNSKLEDVDVDSLEGELNKYYWDYLILVASRLKDSINLQYVLRILKGFHEFDVMLKRKLVLGEDISELSKRYDYASYKHVVRKLSIDSYDYMSNVFRYLHMVSILKYSPLSYDIVLCYMLMKEWEALTLSYIIYLFTNGLEPTYVKKSLKALVDVYGSYY
ncbi:MAG: V-type ATPase subunit [Sulfolobales archaeon]